MISHLMKLYLIALRNDKWLLHLSKTTEPKHVLVECRLMYEYAKTNDPIRIAEEYEMTEILEVDFHVKRNMCKYGIENVRGGTYVDPVLPDYLAKTLDKEFSLNVSLFTNAETHIGDMRTLYDSVLQQDPCLLDYERNAYQLKLKHYNEIYYKWNMVHLTEMQYLQSAPAETSIMDEHESSPDDFEINKSVLADIEWLKMCIVGWKDTIDSSPLNISIDNPTDNLQQAVSSLQLYISKNTHALFRYDIVLNKLRTVIELYKKMKEMEEMETNLDESLSKNPNLILDLFFYGNIVTLQFIQDKGMDTFICGLCMYINVLEHYCYYVLNRKDEYQYDMNLFDTYDRENLENTVDYLNMVLSVTV